jgi:16S rRNA (cytosine967-C5)-methyltransferase
MADDRSSAADKSGPRKQLTPRDRQRQQFMKKQRANAAQKPARNKHSNDEHTDLSGPPGYPVRALAVRLVSAVLDRRRALDDALASEFTNGPGASLEPRDRALARLIATTALRRKGELDAVIAPFIERPLPGDRGLLSTILLCATTQLVLLDIAPHAVLNIAVEQCRHDRGARRFDRLANAVLRRVSERGPEILATLPGAHINVPGWMWDRWVAGYSEETAQRIAEGSLQEAALDLTIKNPDETATWAERLGGVILPTRSIRVANPESRVDALPGFDEGAWWVQDAAAALPARLLGDVNGLDVADLCAAPGGKTAQLAASGARVTAVDVSSDRLRRVRENLTRLNLEADLVAADIETWQPGRTFDAILLDAPCTATGTIRRHPDILYLKRASDLAPLVELQSRLLDRAANLLRPGGRLVYCTCSLEPDEGERQIENLLARNPTLTRVLVTPSIPGLDPTWLTANGELRTLPAHLPATATTPGGMDGFFASVLLKA